MKDHIRLPQIVFCIGIALFVCAFGLGAIQSLVYRGGYPSIYDDFFEDGDFALINQDIEEAVAQYRMITLFQPENPEAFLKLSIALELEGNGTESADAKAKAYKFFQERQRRQK